MHTIIQTDSLFDLGPEQPECRYALWHRAGKFEPWQVHTMAATAAGCWSAMVDDRTCGGQWLVLPVE